MDDWILRNKKERKKKDSDNGDFDAQNSVEYPIV